MSDEAPPLGPTLAEQRATARRLKHAGLKFHEVAREMGIGTDEAYRLVTAARDGSPAEEVAEARARDVRDCDVELARLDDIQARLATVRTSDGDESIRVDMSLEAIDRSLKATEKKMIVLARRAKLLGLDAPAKTDVTVTLPDETPEAIAARAARLVTEAFRGGNVAPFNGRETEPADGAEPAGGAPKV